jgi:thiamine pyrophosphokinase
MRVILFANGDFPNPASHRQLTSTGDLIIAADGGAAHARAAGAIPDVVIGDGDSLEPSLRAELEASGTRFIAHPAAKDETDLELALLYAAEQGADEVIVLAALGGRLDQMVANLLLLTRPELRELHVQVIEGNQSAFMIRHQATITGQPGDTVSLIPLGGAARGVTAEGLAWPLNGATLHFGPARGVSNVLLGDKAQVSVEEGTLLCVVIHGEVP